MKNNLRIITFFTMILIVIISCKSPQKPVETIEKLKAAISNETKSMEKYDAFSQKAKTEGFNNISKLFKATAVSESVHFRNHESVLSDLGESFEPENVTEKADSTFANLRLGIENEEYEITVVYPEFIEVANREKSTEAANSFVWAMEAGKKHSRLFTEASYILNDTGNDQDLSETWFVCPQCGNIYQDVNGLEKCEICNTASNQFINVK